MTEQALTIRAATPHDGPVLARLAGLDSRPQLRGHALLAERDGIAIAAIALSSGSVVADPFHATVGAARVLRRRRYALLRQGGDTGPVRSLMRRLTPVGV